MKINEDLGTLTQAKTASSFYLIFPTSLIKFGLTIKLYSSCSSALPRSRQAKERTPSIFLPADNPYSKNSRQVMLHQVRVPPWAKQEELRGILWIWNL